MQNTERQQEPVLTSLRNAPPAKALSPAPPAQKPAPEKVVEPPKPVVLSAYEMFVSGAMRRRHQTLLYGFIAALGIIAVAELWLLPYIPLVGAITGTVVIGVLSTGLLPLVKSLIREEAGMGRVVHGRDFIPGEYYSTVRQAPKLNGRIWAILETAGVDEWRMVWVMTTDEKLHDYFVKASAKYGGANDFQKVDATDYREMDKKARLNAGRRAVATTPSASVFNLWRQPLEGRPKISEPEGSAASD